MPKGGRQPGAGCPKGTKHKKTLEEEAMRRAIFEFAKEKLEKLLGNLENLSIKDANAAKIILEQALGKPRQRTELASEDGSSGAIVVTWKKDS